MNSCAMRFVSLTETDLISITCLNVHQVSHSLNFVFIYLSDTLAQEHNNGKEHIKNIGLEVGYFETLCTEISISIIGNSKQSQTTQLKDEWI